MFHALMLTCALQGGQVLIILLNTTRRQLHVTESKAVDFTERRKPENPKKNPRSTGETNDNNYHSHKFQI